MDKIMAQAASLPRDPVPPHPTRADGAALTKALCRVLMREYWAPEVPGDQLVGDAYSLLEKLVGRDVAMGVLEAVPQLRATLREDLEAALRVDPAADSPWEVVCAYPGFYAGTVYRLAHTLSVFGATLLPRLMTELAHSRTGIDIHPGARIGPGFFIDHGTGVVIGQTAVVGNNVTLYQGVTLGALSTRQEGKRHPTLEDGVTVYANATILGGDTVIGRDSIIGAHALVTASVAPGTRVRPGGPGLWYRSK